MSTYPSGVFEPRTKANKSGVVYDPLKTTISFVEDTTKLDDEVVAIETELGTDPKGDFDDVKERLDDMDFFSDEKKRIRTLIFQEMIEDSDISNGDIFTGKGMLYMKTDATAYAYALCSLVPYFIDYSKMMKFEMEVYKITVASSGLLKFCCDLTEGDDDEIGIGFQVEGTTVYAMNGNGGASGTKTDITASVTIGDGKHRWGWVFTPATSIKFYFDGVLVATHTTNLPTTEGMGHEQLLSVYLTNGGSATASYFKGLQISGEIER